MNQPLLKTSRESLNMTYSAGELEDAQTGNSEASGCDDHDLNPSLELCVAALKFLSRCAGILASMYSMPACPMFHTTHR
jgi:hypothetical protein